MKLIFVDYLSIIASDTHGAKAEASLMVTVESPVVPENHAPTVRISPTGDKNVTLGESVILKSIATDIDGDTLTTSWKLKNVTASGFTSVPKYGETGFNYTFDELGTYLVVVEVEDGNGSIGDANITVNVSEAPPVTLTLNDINTSIVVKGQDSFPDQGQSGVAATLKTAPKHGTVEFYLVGNESPYIHYTSTDCFVGKDSFIYKSGNDYGRVNVTITSASTLHSLSETHTLYNTETVSGEYLRAKSGSESVQITTDTHGGISSLTVVGNEIINYNYDPDDSFVGNDYFEYTVSETIDECSYSEVGRIDFVVEAPLGKVHLFNWYDDVHGGEIWRTDGTVAGTQMVKDIWPGTNSGGAVIVKDLNPGINGRGSIRGSSLNGFRYFSANDGTHSTELWKTDGTEAETVIVEDFGDFYDTGYMGPGYLQAFGNKLLFVKDEEAGNGPNWEPWVSNGSSSAYKLDILPGGGASDFKECIELNSKCYADANDHTHGSELWMTDGTESGTQMVKNIYEETNGQGQNGVGSQLTLVGDKLFFIGRNLSNGFALWKSNGTESGTLMVKDFFSDDDGSSYVHAENYSDFTDVDGTLYFIMDDEVHGKEIYKSDGTEQGTVMVKDIGSGDYSVPSELTNVQGTLYFWYSDDNNDSNSGLWKSDGTEAGTVLVKAFSADYRTGFELTGSGLTTEDGKVYIEVMDFENNYIKEYWISDGTEVGTFKLVDGESMGGEEG